ncbi:MAG TPA: aminotransferase class V-fold PLP-dependent enzyme [Caulobacteraceae bacterium]|nr:aminotransferase class V-fold PLP-dependent enzyme [Caulobacteraceae bacterium]
MSAETDALERAYHHALTYLAGLDAQSVSATTSAATLRTRLAAPLPETGTPAARVIDDLVAATEGGHVGSAGGRFFGWVIGGALPSALGADWLTSTWDENTTIAASGPAGAAVEEVAGAWIKEVLDLPREASFAFTTGCQMAHVTGLAAARHALLAREGWDVEEQGLFGAPPIRVLANDQRHGSAVRALRFLGLGAGSLRSLPTRDGRLGRSTLEQALADGGGPTIVLLNAGDLNLGAFDDFTRLIPIARAAGTWVHVDGAFGLWARASREHRALTEGVDLADSWATDAHKWLNTPKDIGVAIVRDAVAHRAAMTQSASYIDTSGELRDAIDWTPDWTRRARGHAVYAALRELGRKGVADMIDRCCRQAATMAEGIAALPGAELVAPAILNQAMVRFPDPRASDDDAHDRQTLAVIDAVNASGEAYFSGTVWQGRRAMRISVCNWRTTDRDVERAVAAVAAALRG